MLSHVAKKTRTNFLAVVAFIERQPLLVRGFEALFRRFPFLERLILRQIGAARAPEGRRSADGCVWYLPADPAKEAQWQRLLTSKGPV